MKKTLIIVISIALASLTLYFFSQKKTADLSAPKKSYTNYQDILVNSTYTFGEEPIATTEEQKEKVEEKAEIVPETGRVFVENFATKGTLEQGGSMEESKSDSLWVNSGGFLYFEKGVGRTIYGKLKESDPVRKKYNDYNADETDDGYHPQNIFRLITKSKWTNYSQEAYFYIAADNLSKSEHRAESNGILLFNHYQDGDNLYYAGLRVDGAAVIKKKQDGDYTQLAYKPVFEGEYDRKQQPNLLPKRSWIGLKTEVADNPDGSTSLKLFIDKNRSGKWEFVFEVTDTEKPIKGPAFAGIRTDFMDVAFDDYRIEEQR